MTCICTWTCSCVFSGWRRWRSWGNLFSGARPKGRRGVSTSNKPWTVSVLFVLSLMTCGPVGRSFWSRGWSSKGWTRKETGSRRRCLDTKPDSGSKMSGWGRFTLTCFHGPSLKFKPVMFDSVLNPKNTFTVNWNRRYVSNSTTDMYFEYMCVYLCRTRWTVSTVCWADRRSWKVSWRLWTNESIISQNAARSSSANNTTLQNSKRARQKRRRPDIIQLNKITLRPQKPVEVRTWKSFEGIVYVTPVRAGLRGWN